MSIAIKTESLSKKYTLRHQKTGSYTALRDVMAESLKRIGKRLLHPFLAGEHTRPTREDFWALRDVSLEINEGDRIGIIGRNGAGKTTLLKILSQITEPTAGVAHIRGRVASLLEVGTGFHPELTGRENVFLNGAILGMTKSEIKRKFDEIVAFAEVEKFLDTPVKRYSSGMYVRLAFAVAAHLETDILIVDEVLAVGDAQFQQKCLGKMGDVAQQGRTLLFVSHNMAAVKQLCRHGIWLDQGGIHRIGEAGKIVEEYILSGADADGERAWISKDNAPGNEIIRLRGVRVKDSKGKVSAILDMTSPFSVEIEYDVLQARTGLRTGFWMYTFEGTLVFVAGDNEDPEWRDKQRLPGRYLSTCIIPEMLLNSGGYSLTVAADIQGSTLLFIEQYVLNFRIEHTGVTTLDGASRSPGIICPSLNWQVVKTEEHS